MWFHTGPEQRFIYTGNVFSKSNPDSLVRSRKQCSATSPDSSMQNHIAAEKVRVSLYSFSSSLPVLILSWLCASASYPACVKVFVRSSMRQCSQFSDKRVFSTECHRWWSRLHQQEQREERNGIEGRGSEPSHPEQHQAVTFLQLHAVTSCPAEITRLLLSPQGYVHLHCHTRAHFLNP